MNKPQNSVIFTDARSLKEKYENNNNIYYAPIKWNSMLREYNNDLNYITTTLDLDQTQAIPDSRYDMLPNTILMNDLNIQHKKYMRLICYNTSSYFTLCFYDEIDPEHSMEIKEDSVEIHKIVIQDVLDNQDAFQKIINWFYSVFIGNNSNELCKTKIYISNKRFFNFWNNLPENINIYVEKQKLEISKAEWQKLINRYPRDTFTITEQAFDSIQ